MPFIFLFHNLLQMKLITLLFSAFWAFASFSQYQPSIHQEQLEEYNASGLTLASDYESLQTVEINLSDENKKNCNLNKVVYGWHPYWVGSAYTNYQWDRLSHFSFFSYEVDASTGESLNSHGWSTSAAVDAALASGNTKVTLCVTLFSGHNTFFGNATAQQTLIDNLINLVQARGAHGVNIDFEGLPSGQKTNFANFMVSLSNQMHSAIPGSEVSTVLYAVDWSNVFDFSIMEPAVDHYIIMGYAYYYAGSGTAGPTDPLYHFGSSYNYTLSKSITYYLDKGCPKDKLILGLPSYGYEWATSSTSIPSSTTASGSAKTFNVIMNNSSGNYSAANHQWEQDSYADAFVFNDGTTKQCFISLDSAWRKRLEHVNNTGIGGIGIWALGYDNGYTDLWDAIGDYLTDCYASPCSGTIHDFGGPYKNYYNDENYTWTVQPPNATSIDVNFTEFDVELDYDYLYIYDGDSDASPQIAGSPFTGTTSPGSFTTSTGAVTFKFTSDGATVTPGFLAEYYCNTVPEPVADFEILTTNICLGDSVLLINNSTDGETYQWTTSGGGLSSSTAFEPYLFPLSSGVHNVSLVVTNASGQDSFNQSFDLTVYSAPNAVATVNSNQLTIPNAIAYFTNLSSNATSYYWDFGDLATSTSADPWHEYTANGVYTVMMVAENPGCEADTTYLTIEVGTQGISELENSDFNIYPNPSSNNIYWTTSLIIEEVYLTDLTGKKVNVYVLENSIDINELEDGVYFFWYVVEGKHRNIKIMKQ